MVTEHCFNVFCVINYENASSLIMLPEISASLLQEEKIRRNLHSQRLSKDTFIQQTFLEHLLCTTHNSRKWGYSDQHQQGLSIINTTTPRIRAYRVGMR